MNGRVSVIPSLRGIRGTVYGCLTVFGMTCTTTQGIAYNPVTNGRGFWSPGPLSRPGRTLKGRAVSETQKTAVVQVRRAAPGDADAIARIKVDTWRTTYRGMVPDRYLERMSYAAHAEDWSRITEDPANFAYVAEDEAGKAVGFVAGGPRWNGPERYVAELYALYIRADHQCRGVGTRLMETLVATVERAGYSSMLLWVLTENHRARAFYEKLGGVTVAAQEFEIDGVRIGEVAYGWEQTGTLLDRLCTRDRAAGTGAKPAQMATSPSKSSSRSGS